MQKPSLSFCWWGCVLGFLLSIGCTSQYVIPPDGEYDYRLPVVSGQVQRAFEHLLYHTVKVTWSPTYRVMHYTHDFTSNTGMRLLLPQADANSPTGYRLMPNGVRQTEETFAKTGAGILLARTKLGEERDAAAVLTVGHLVTGPDTIRSYVRDARGFPTQILSRLAIKTGETVFVTGRGGEQLGATVKAVDVVNDLALMTISIPWAYEDLQPFGFKLGKMADIGWGTLVYVLGYPKGQERLSGGVVSLDKQPGRFFLDAAIQPGYSGGPVIAVRDGLPHFELIGLCRGATTRQFRRLVPDAQLPVGAAISEDVLDHIYVEEIEEVEYGLGFAVSIDVMKAFVLANRSVLVEKGIDVQNNSLLKMWGF